MYSFGKYSENVKQCIFDRVIKIYFIKGCKLFALTEFGIFKNTIFKTYIES